MKHPIAPARAAATRLGLVHYSGIECQRSHGRARYTSSGACVACVKEAAKRSSERLRCEASKARRPQPPPPQQPQRNPQPIVWWTPRWRAVDE